MAGYIGAQPFTEASYSVEERVATAGQTLFNINYTPNFLEVLMNGVTLRKVDYVANDGSTVTFNEGLTEGDEVTFKAYGTFNVADTYSKVALDEFMASTLKAVADNANNHLTLKLELMEKGVI